MKRQLFLLCTFLFALSVHTMAQKDYTSLWKQVEMAQEKDLPRTQIKHLDAIVSLAKRQKDYGHLLKAQYMRAVCLTAISPDSLPIIVEQLEEERKRSEKTNPLLYQIQSALLARIYEQNISTNESYKTKSEDCTAAALQDAARLATTPAGSMTPAVVEEADSKIFGNDLLHVVGFFLDKPAILHKYYSTADNPTAACLALLQMPEVTESKEKLDSLQHVYGNLPVGAEIAVRQYSLMLNDNAVTAAEKYSFLTQAINKWSSWQRTNILRNWLSSLTNPMFELETESDSPLPGKPFRVRVNQLRNTPRLKFNVYRTTLTGDQMPSNNSKETLSTLKKKSRLLRDHSMELHTGTGAAEYEILKDSIDMPQLPVGIYLLEAYTPEDPDDSCYKLIAVTGLRSIQQSLPGNRLRVAVVNAETGKPIEGALVELSARRGYNTAETVSRYRTDKNGEVIADKVSNQSYQLFVSTDNDHAYIRHALYNNYYNVAEHRVTDRSSLFTDRSIYRPGQTVQVAVLTYRDKPDHSSETLANREVTLSFFDANHQAVAEHHVTTDNYGKASAIFTLPDNKLTGLYSIRSSFGNQPNAFIRVEEYKRPTFRIESEPISTRLTPNDSVTLTVKAETYSGVPVEQAKAEVTVVRRNTFWWWYRTANTESETLLQQTFTTDEQGMIRVNVPLTIPPTKENSSRINYNFDVTVSITNPAGETHQYNTSLHVSNRETVLNCQMNELWEQSEKQELMFNYINSQGVELEGTVNYTVDGKRYTAPTNTRVAFPVLHPASGKHLLTAVCGNDTITKEFTTFSINDTAPPVSTHDWFYISSTKFNEDNKPVYLQVGSTDPQQHIYYTIVSTKGVMEQNCIHLNGGNHLFTLPYRSDYQDGVTVSLAWVNNGKVYTHAVKIERTLPSTELKLQWNTFRDRLQPGEEEEWTLRVLTPDGKPAAAQLLTGMYDKSLDDLLAHRWTLDTGLGMRIPSIGWMRTPSSKQYLHYSYNKYIRYDVSALTFTHFDTEMLSIYGARLFYHDRGPLLMSKMAAPMSMDAVAVTESAPQILANAINTGSADLDMPIEKATQHTETGIRENLQETAFFYPALLTDGSGNVSVKFRLPESLTTWHVMALAHDKAMRHAQIEADVIVQKRIMLQPNMPRFLRAGDKGTIAAQVMNTTEQTVNGKVMFCLIEPESGDTILTEMQDFSAEGKHNTTVCFSVTPDNRYPLLVCRMVAATDNYSDGEQHYLPVMSDSETVTHTLPFIQSEQGTLNVDLTSILPHSGNTTQLTVEYTNHPAWLMIQALPAMSNPATENAIDMAAAIYSNTLARHIATLKPEIRTTIEQWRREEGKETSLMSTLEKNQELKNLDLNNTPWVAKAHSESTQRQQIITLFDENNMNHHIGIAVNKLSELQNEDGSWSWWTGMPGSLSITTAVAEMLTRLNTMIGEQSSTRTMLNLANRYMQQCLIDEMYSMKKQEKKGHRKLLPSDNAIRCLYIDALSPTQLSPEAQKAKDYMIEHMLGKQKEFSIYGKAITALIFACNRQTQRAKENLQSMEEYLVESKTMGQYYDTRKSQYSWFNYRIPTQVAVIETFQLLQPDNSKKVISAMQQWLLCQKRVQDWDTPVNTVNAIHAFLNGQMGTLSTQGNRPSVLSIDSTILKNQSPTAGLGYVKHSMTYGNNGESLPTHLTAEKTSEGISWGAVYTQYTEKTALIGSSSAGLSVKREVIGNNKVLHVGDKVTVRITISADRDYDFVQLQDQRAACMEPVRQLSGYQQGYYISPKDNCTNYYFNKLHKGSHVIETDYYVDRAGTYLSGICTIQCAYSPEFCGHSEAICFTIE